MTSDSPCAAHWQLSVSQTNCERSFSNYGNASHTDMSVCDQYT